MYFLDLACEFKDKEPVMTVQDEFEKEKILSNKLDRLPENLEVELMMTII